MRTTDTLFDLEHIPILFQYLYLDDNHKITVDNGITQLEIRMTDSCGFLARNMRFPELPELNYTDMMTVPNMLGIIAQLKSAPPIEYSDCFSSRWEEIKTITDTNVAQNKLKRRVNT